MKLLDEPLLDFVSKGAKESPRLRMNYNLHTDTEMPLHRLLNAIEPGTEIPVHRHFASDETLVVLRGRLRVDLFDDQGVLTMSQVIDPLKGVYGIDIAVGEWHRTVCLEEGTVMLETKLGPYRPLMKEELMEEL